MSTKPANVSCELCLSRKFSLFNEVSAEHLCHLSDNKSFISHKKGQILFYEGTRPLGLFCINTGSIKIYKTASNGKEQIVRLAKGGDFVGYANLLGEEQYSCSATILEDASVCFIPKESFMHLLTQDSNLSRKLMKAACHEIGEMEAKLTDSTQKSVRERLAQTLLMLKDTYGIDGGESVKIDIALSREDLANIVGTATETLIRLLSEFKSDGLIEMDGKKIKVLNAKGLAKLADFYG
ncbi:Crp/Fnr family transcriptional regulator [Cytophagales bacterium LB-30]|uniref:Crp/Fnr family transcriptional regulator n=1 Tax=Shiella aurantiaca TaxID=3058365 RepID=A0ABT8F2V6_9BACT|nr:Crp/Fnr family transcriptional regulator [Shiella aurantiaca]MDN4164561.1 Crp/Fnr family transcriptional regulator [Shiella aurantiaca]